MASGRHQVLIRSEVARWKALEPPYGASQDEIEACRARRADYAERLTAGVAMLVQREGFLSALGRVLGRVAASPPSMGVPEVSTLVHRLGEELEAQARPANALHPDQLPLCRRCERDGGITLYGRRQAPQRATVVPGHVVRDDSGRARPAVAEALCGHHVELAAWEAVGSKTSPPYPAPGWTRPNSPAAQALVEKALRARATPAPPRAETPRPTREPGDDTGEIAAGRTAGSLGPATKYLAHFERRTGLRVRARGSSV